MSDRSDFERRLDDLRQSAAATGRIDAPGVHAAGSPVPLRDGVLAEYYGQPLLKRPVWTWEIPAYFFVGGAAGASSVIGAVANAMGGRPDLVRDARWVAAAGAALSPPLLISDLGRPERFLSMLRVFKLQSPMSVGVWTLLAFSNAAGAAALADFIDRKSGGRIPVRVIGNAAEVLSAATGLVLSTYTGVLIGATTIPVWSRNVRLLPLHFGASGIGTAVSVLELIGHRDPALNALGIGAAAIETAIGFSLEGRDDPALDPLKHGWSGHVTRVGGVLSGPVPLALRVLGARSRSARRAAAVSTIVGSILTRAGWLSAGRQATTPPAETPATATAKPDTERDR